MNSGKLDKLPVGAWMIWGKLDNGWIMQNWTMDETYENGAMDGDKEKDGFQNFEFRIWIMEEWGEVGCDTRNEFEEIENWARDEPFQEVGEQMNCDGKWDKGCTVGS